MPTNQSYEEFEKVIVLSDEFFQEISAHSISTELDAVRVLAPSPAVLDLFMWLSYPCLLSEGGGAGFRFSVASALLLNWRTGVRAATSDSGRSSNTG